VVDTDTCYWLVRLRIDVFDKETCYRPRHSRDLMYLTQRLLMGLMAWGFDVVDTETCYWLDGLGI